jgi:pterin-4a-carbinolamine dehydratase
LFSRYLEFWTMNEVKKRSDCVTHHRDIPLHYSYIHFERKTAKAKRFRHT